ncbi:MAG: RDD family protein [Cytophagaceae bacterium]
MKPEDSLPSYKDFPKADPVQRLSAGIIDLVIVGVSGTTLSFLPFSSYYTNPLLLAYFLLRDSLPVLQGKSIGKTLIGLRVVREIDGSGITNDYGLGIVRNVLFMIPLAGFIDAFMIFSQAGQRFGDRWAKTIVIAEKKQGTT